MSKLLPPKYVRDAFLGEKGIIAAPRGEAQQELVRDWFVRQEVFQTEAKRIQGVLQEIEPMSEELARQGQLPRWAVEKWASVLLFDWSAELGKAVAEAEAYLESRKTPTR
jgi:hypothetical protein